ncbi:MAG: hypothetical protein LBO06_07285 [Bacteroidales bacterium]|jgi:hypothetical protein|nr:hypothetical protein [Bacteroidales bacterium]
MKAALFLPAFATLLIAACSTNNPIDKKTDLEAEGSKGKVKSVREISYKAIDTLRTIRKEDIVRYGNPSSLVKYNNQGYTTEYIEYFGDRLEGRSIYQYEDTKLIKANSYNGNDSLVGYTIYKYNKNLITDIHYLPDGEVEMKYVHKYDKEGREITVYAYADDGGLELKLDFKYDNEGRVIEQKQICRGNSFYEKKIYKYDSNEMVIEEDSEFDAGNEIGHSLTTFKYKIDKHGNWIERIRYNGRFITITERQIEYYE